MKRILVSLHAALIAGVLLPVFGPDFLNPGYSPFGEAARFFAGRHTVLWSVLAAGLPGALALLNLPLLLRLRGGFADRWRAFSTVVLGLLSTSLLSQLLSRYGYGRMWGGAVLWVLSLGLLIAGTAAVARLKPAAPPLPVIRDS